MTPARTGAPEAHLCLQYRGAPAYTPRGEKGHPDVQRLQQ
jgi:hypothetical protein